MDTATQAQPETQPDDTTTQSNPNTTFCERFGVSPEEYQRFLDTAEKE